MSDDARATIEEVYRTEWGRIVATLIRLVGDFDLAEEVAQEAFAAAVQDWPTAGIPKQPRAWIIQSARHKAIDRTRRQAHFAEIIRGQVDTGAIWTAQEPDADASDIADDQLRLMF